MFKNLFGWRKADKVKLEEDNIAPPSENTGTWFHFWEHVLNQEDRLCLSMVYKPIGGAGDGSDAERLFLSLDKSNKAFGFCNLSQIGGLFDWIDFSSNADLANKLISIALDEQNNADSNERHFLILNILKFLKRNNSNQAFEIAELMVSFSEDAAAKMLSLYPNASLPSHAGFEYLIGEAILRKDYSTAVNLYVKAQSEGWNIGFLESDILDLLAEEKINPNQFGLRVSIQEYTNEEVENNPRLNAALLRDEAIRLIETNQKADDKIKALTQFLDENLRGDFMEIETYFAIARAQLESGNIRKANMIIEMFKVEACKVPNTTIGEFYKGIAKEFNNVGKPDLALRWIEIAVKFDANVGAKRLRTNILNKIDKQRST